MTKLLNSLNYVGLNDAQKILSNSLNEEIDADQLWKAVESGKVNLCVKLKQGQLPKVGLRNTGPDSLTFCIDGFDFKAELIESMRNGVRPDGVFTLHDFVLMPVISSDGNSIPMQSALPIGSEVLFATSELKSLINPPNAQAVIKSEKDGFGRDTLLKIIGALLEAQEVKQEALIEVISSRKAHGLSKRNLERAFAEAKKAYVEVIQ